LIENNNHQDPALFSRGLFSIYEKHEAYDLHEYANEVLEKRSLKEYGVAIDLGALYQQYLGNEFHSVPINYPSVS
ncbi:MAG: hypothetical protein KDD76_03435, partial [Rickettsiales bacterium]|nr:hypothetical protein [Rickettsiales bacterium]